MAPQGRILPRTEPLDKMVAMEIGVSHDRADESPESKARWFQSLPLSERMEMLCEFTDLALALNPRLADRDHAQPVGRRIQILSPP